MNRRGRQQLRKADSEVVTIVIYFKFHIEHVGYYDCSTALDSQQTDFCFPRPRCPNTDTDTAKLPH